MIAKKSYSTEYWKTKVQQCTQSGKSMRAWCREHNIIYTTFVGWKNRLDKHRPKTADLPQQNSSSALSTNFIELKNQPTIEPGISLEYREVIIHLSGGFDSITLQRCLNVLKGGLC